MTAPSVKLPKPTVRKTNLRALVFAAAGPEQPYDVYRFSNDKRKFELPQHNPFKGL